MSPRRYARTQWAIGLALLTALSGCDRKPPAPRKDAAATVPAPAPTPAPAQAVRIEFEAIDPGTIQTRGIPSGTEGRFIARPGVVASPCGFHLVVGGADSAWTALLVGHELAWTKEGMPSLLRLDGVTLDIGLVDGKAMGASTPQAPAALLQLAGQWESTWLRREAGAEVPIKNNASGQAHLEPHPDWRAWSATLGPNKTSADVPTSSVIVATVALDARVLVLRALLDGEQLALRALRRLVFAVDSIERHPQALGRREYVETLQKAAQVDPTCAGIHAAHDAQLQ